MNKKKFWSIFFEIFFIFILNGGLIAFIVMNCVSYKAVLKNGAIIEISYWDALSSKAVYDLAKDIFKWLPEYHFYNKLIVYIMIIIGGITSFKLCFIFKKWNKNLKENENENVDDQKILYKKLYAKSQVKLLSKREHKKLEQLIKKFGTLEDLTNEQ